MIVLSRIQRAAWLKFHLAFSLPKYFIVLDNNYQSKGSTEKVQQEDFIPGYCNKGDQSVA